MQEADANEHVLLLDRTAQIISAFVSNNHIQAAELPALITSVYVAVAALSQPTAEAEASHEKATPAQIRKSIQPDRLISFIDGKAYKAMKRHLSHHGLDPVSYRERYGLPVDYPMTSPDYSKRRSELARSAGLGRQLRGHVGAVVEAAMAPGEAAPAERSGPANGGRRGRAKPLAAE